MNRKSCLKKEFHKLYAPEKSYMGRKQKIAIALNKCKVPKKIGFLDLQPSTWLKLGAIAVAVYYFRKK